VISGRLAWSFLTAATSRTRGLLLFYFFIIIIFILYIHKRYTHTYGHASSSLVIIISPRNTEQPRTTIVVDCVLYILLYTTTLSTRRRILNRQLQLQRYKKIVIYTHRKEKRRTCSVVDVYAARESTTGYERISVCARVDGGGKKHTYYIIYEWNLFSIFIYTSPPPDRRRSGDFKNTKRALKIHPLSAYAYNKIRVWGTGDNYRRTTR